ncbi:MAG: hypothetical protein DMF37_09570 [Verrucomicrobia bacterium]|nr:MAG: hypothetical protein DMF37_09570 [Verrucomicrobiota bacterium]
MVFSPESGYKFEIEVQLACTAENEEVWKLLFIGSGIDQDASPRGPGFSLSNGERDRGPQTNASGAKDNPR